MTLLEAVEHARLYSTPDDPWVVERWGDWYCTCPAKTADPTHICDEEE